MQQRVEMLVQKLDTLFNEKDLTVAYIRKRATEILFDFWIQIHPADEDEDLQLRKTHLECCYMILFEAWSKSKPKDSLKKVIRAHLVIKDLIKRAAMNPNDYPRSFSKVSSGTKNNPKPDSESESESDPDQPLSSNPTSPSVMPRPQAPKADCEGLCTKISDNLLKQLKTSLTTTTEKDIKPLIEQSLVSMAT
jgi:hypothetical protein